MIFPEDMPRIDALIAGQEGLERVDRETIEAIQLKKLNRLLAREKERGGFYRDLPERLFSLADLPSLPFTTDEQLAANAPGLLLRSQSEISRVLSDATSGTTGAAKRVFYTEGDCERTVEFFMAGLGELIAEAVSRLGARPLKLGAAGTYGEWSEIMQREKPDSFVGMPVQLLRLLRVCGRGSRRRALVSGDLCPAAVMEGCEELLGSRLFPHYGSREMCLGGAITCPAHAGMHLRENHVIAEIVDEDGKVLPPGEYGELVITTIGMEAMPLIRYRTGDHTRILPGPCPCGSEALRLDAVSRRDGGEEMAALDEILFRLPFVADYRAERHNGRLHLEILTCGEGELPPLDAQITKRPARPEDGALYRSKRRIENS